MDRDGGYGWVSIILHWLTAVAILALLFAGDSISVEGAQARRFHTTVGVTAWLFLAARIAWRLHQGHPPRAQTQGRFSFLAGASVHYILLAGVALMLVSGPVLGWVDGGGVQVFSVRIPGSSEPHPGAFSLAQSIHAAGAVTLALGTCIHVAGVLKHMFIDRDRTFDRIMTPPRRPRRGFSPDRDET